MCLVFLDRTAAAAGAGRKSGRAVSGADPLAATSTRLVQPSSDSWTAVPKRAERGRPVGASYAGAGMARVLAVSDTA